MAETVLADAQFGIARILRPYAGFETDYQGANIDRRIMMTEVLTPPGGEALDERARLGETGYDPNLVRGLKVPMGARVLIWFPKIVPLNELSTGADIRYQWTIEWRMRNVFDFRQSRIPFHYPKQGQGVADTTGATPSSRVIIPSANQTTIYSQSEPAGIEDVVFQNARVEGYTFGGIFPDGVPDFGLPLVPGGATGAIQQGIMDPATFPGTALGARASFYQLIETQAGGDELLIGITRVDPGGPGFQDWAFGQFPGEFDATLSTILGIGFLGPSPTGPFPDLAVYVMVGSAP